MEEEHGKIGDGRYVAIRYNMARSHLGYKVLLNDGAIKLADIKHREGGRWLGRMTVKAIRWGRGESGHGQRIEGTSFTPMNGSFNV